MSENEKFAKDKMLSHPHLAEIYGEIDICIDYIRDKFKIEPVDSLIVIWSLINLYLLNYNYDFPSMEVQKRMNRITIHQNYVVKKEENE